MDSRNDIPRPNVPKEQKQQNVGRHIPARPVPDGGGENPASIDPHQEAPNTTDVEPTGPIADRAREMPGLWDPERVEDGQAGADETGDTGDVEIHHKKRGS